MTVQRRVNSIQVEKTKISWFFKVSWIKWGLNWLLLDAYVLDRNKREVVCLLVARGQELDRAWHHGIKSRNSGERKGVVSKEVTLTLSLFSNNKSYSLEGLRPKLKFQYFGCLMRRTDSLEKTLMLGKIEGRRRRGRQRMRWLKWHHRLNGHELE